MAGEANPEPSRRLDNELLRYLAGIFGQLQEVTQTSLFPANRQESLVVEFETTLYPEAIEAVRLEIRAYTNGDFHITYLETDRGKRRHCRWDRHEQPHSSRDHFHPLEESQQVANREFPEDVTAVLRQIVLPWIEQRLGDCWESKTE